MKSNVRMKKRNKVMMVNRKSFTSEAMAQRFAKEVNGIVKYMPLPSYFETSADWIVEWGRR